MRLLLLALFIMLSISSVRAADSVSFTGGGLKTSAGFVTWQNLSELPQQINALTKQVKTLQVCLGVAAVALIYLTFFKKSGNAVEKNCSELCDEQMMSEQQA